MSRSIPNILKDYQNNGNFENSYSKFNNQEEIKEPLKFLMPPNQSKNKCNKKNTKYKENNGNSFFINQSFKNKKDYKNPNINIYKSNNFIDGNIKIEPNCINDSLQKLKIKNSLQEESLIVS